LAPKQPAVSTTTSASKCRPAAIRQGRDVCRCPRSVVVISGSPSRNLLRESVNREIFSLPGRFLNDGVHNPADSS
jgi:hypothetical protein